MTDGEGVLQCPHCAGDVLPTAKRWRREQRRLPRFCDLRVHELWAISRWIVDNFDDGLGACAPDSRRVLQAMEALGIEVRAYSDGSARDAVEACERMEDIAPLPAWGREEWHVAGADAGLEVAPLIVSLVGSMRARGERIKKRRARVERALGETE